MIEDLISKTTSTLTMIAAQYGRVRNASLIWLPLDITLYTEKEHSLFVSCFPRDYPIGNDTVCVPSTHPGLLFLIIEISGTAKSAVNELQIWCETKFDHSFSVPNRPTWLQRWDASPVYKDYITKENYRYRRPWLQAVREIWLNRRVMFPEADQAMQTVFEHSQCFEKASSFEIPRQAFKYI